MPAPSLLIVHQGALGDLVCIFSLIRALRRRYRPVALLCQGQLGKLAAGLGLVDAWFPVEAAWSASLFTEDPGGEAARRLAGFSHALVFSASAPLAAALRRIGLTHVCRLSPRPPAGRRVHVSEHALQHVLGCGLISAADAERLGSETPPGLSTRPAPPQGVVIHPGAGSPRKRWPLEKFLALAERLAADGRLSEFVIGPAEEDLAGRLARRGVAIHRPADAPALLDRLFQAAACIGNDSGVSHLAAWVGRPTVAIFGPTDPVRWRPRGPAVAVVRPELDCLPCFETAGQNCDAAACLETVSIEAVLAALARVWPAPRG